MTKRLFKKIRLFWPLTKSLQTGLLVATGMAGYMSARCPVHNLSIMLGLLISLLASIAGSTILNMWFDRDIDSKMERTRSRPLASGKIKPNEALWVGLIFSFLGVGLALLMNIGFGIIIFAGLFFDVVVYTIWLKRRTCWSIVWGGISGGMPILAGRFLGMGSLDWIGVVLALGILLWIPTHILTFNMRYAKDYLNAGIPTVVSVHGTKVNQAIIAVSSILAAIAMGMAAWGIGLTWGCLRLLSVLSIGLIILALSMIIRPSERINFGLFKYASIYMLSSMLLMVF